MASMWRRAMVYLGLQDDDELEYGGEYESYGEYADAADEPQNPRARRDPGRDDADGRNGPPRDSGTVRTRPDTRTEYGADYGAPERRARPSRTGAGPRRAVGHVAPRPERGAHHRPDHRGPGARRRAAGLQRRAGGRRPPQGEPAGDPQPAGPADASCSGDSSTSRAASRTRSRGSMQRVADQVFLLTPSNVEVSQEEKDRLQARGLFQP